MKVKKYVLKPLMSEDDSDKLKGKFLTEDECTLLITHDADVYDKESGKCLAKFRKKTIPGNIVKTAYESLLSAATAHPNRGVASGNSREFKVRKNGKLAKTGEAAMVNSGLVGYYDRTVRMPFCRLTAFNQQDFDKFKNAYPIIKFVDNKYKELMPEHYAKQRKMADNTSQDFVIKDTSFTTVTVNKNWQTAVHKDAGDFKEGFGNLVALRNGTFTGGYFTLPRWGCGFDLQNGDLLLVDVHQWHGNTPIQYENKKTTRLSLVMYYREGMKFCGTIEQELKRAKTRKKGDKVKGEL